MKCPKCKEDLELLNHDPEVNETRYTCNEVDCEVTVITVEWETINE